MTCPACSSPVPPSARFCSQCGARLPEAVVPALPGRRQLTAMFCDLVNSTGLADMLHAEEYREVLLAYRDCCKAIIERNRGDMAGSAGDGILAQFGYPAAREDGPQRAVHTGIEICERVAELSKAIEARYGAPLAVRVGIHSGMVITGESGAGRPGGEGAVGKALNIASRVQEAAPPNTVVITRQTLRLVQGQFITHTIGPRRLKGLAQDIELFQVVESSSARSLFEARAATGLSLLVGRTRQLDALDRQWAAARRGECRLALVAGDPGIGKSRLIHEFQKRVADDTAVQITCNCAEHFQNTAFYAVATELGRVFGVRAGDDWAGAATKVRAALQRLGSADQDIPGRMALLFADPGTAAGRPPASSQEVRGRILEAITAYVSIVTSRVPLLLIFEDLHWADPSTLDVLSHLHAGLGAAPALILASARPGAASHLRPDARLDLDRMTPAQCEALVQAAAGEHELEPAVMRDIVDRSDGVPLFAEELAKSVRERLDAGQPQHGAMFGADVVPASLRDSLMARLDRLGPAKDVAQTAAVVGRTFRLDLLQHLFTPPRPGLRAELQALVDAGLVFPKRTGLNDGPGPVYEFKHELLRTAAYESLLRGPRRDIHRRVAATLAASFPEEAGRHPELAAHHYTEGGQPELALPLWERAGQRCVRRSANLEAVAHLSRALDVLAALPATPDRAGRELSLHLQMAAPLMAAKGYGAPELERTLGRAIALSTDMDDAASVLPLLYGRWSYQQATGQVAQSLHLAERFAGLAQRRGGPEADIVANRLLGTSLQVTGRPAPAAAALERALALFDDARDTRLAYLYGADLKATTLCSLSLAQATLGRQATALRSIDAACARADALNHRNTLAYCGSYRLAIWAMCRQAEGFEALLARHGHLLAEEPLPVWTCTLRGYEGWLLMQRGRPDEAVDALRASIAAMQALNLVIWQGTTLMWLGEACGRAGRGSEAEAAFAQSRKVMERSGERWAEAELYRLWAAQRARAGGSAAAFLLQSLEVSSQQGTAAFTLRTRLDMLRRQGRDGSDGSCRQAVQDALARMPEQSGADCDEAAALLDEAGVAAELE